MTTVKCLKCGKVLTSNFSHQFEQCDCSNRTFASNGGYGGNDSRYVQVIKES
jgi:hypothetical protein